MQSTASYIEAPYTFYDNGYQQSMLYIDTGRAGMSATDTAKTYTYSLEFNAYGLIASTVLMLRGENTDSFNSVITFRPDGNAEASNYGTEKYITLSSAQRSTDGWWKVEFTARGTGSYLTSEWSVVTSDYETANAENNTGTSHFGIRHFGRGKFRIFPLRRARAFGQRRRVRRHRLCGIASASTKAGDGIEGKSLKAVYDFWSTAEGGWQKSRSTPMENNPERGDEGQGKQYV